MRGWTAVPVVAAVALIVAAVPAQADEPHHVRYTVTAQERTAVAIYFREADPPNWADYSHNPYQYSPKAEADIGPDTPWVREVVLTDPQQWAMVSAGIGRASGTPNIRCELAVEGVVVATGEGARGALCSMRHW
jgi:hypothetical protein